MKRAVLLLSLGLGACGLSEQQCNQGDWFGIGRKDGRQGHLPDRIHKHAKSCAEFGITPNVALWEDGRQRGLKTYCTVENAYDIGRRGASFRPSCAPVDQPVLNAAFRKGERYFELTEEINELETEIETIRTDIAEASDDKNRLSKYTRSDITLLQLRIFMLESERRRFGRL